MTLPMASSLLAALLSQPAAASPAPAAAQAQQAFASPEREIRATLSHWYGELAKKEEGRLWGLTAPGFIDSTPPDRHVNNGSRALGPRV